MTLILTPEQEARLTNLVKSGRFSSPEQAIGVAIDSLPSIADDEDDFPEGKLNLVELFAQSPFKGLDIDISRDTSTLRDIDW